MGLYLDRYNSWIKNGRDLVLADNILGQPVYDSLVVPVKGAIALYKLGQEIALHGVHLGHVMRGIYQRYGTALHTHLANDQIFEVIDEVTGSDLTIFLILTSTAKKELFCRICTESVIRWSNMSLYLPLLLK